MSAPKLGREILPTSSRTGVPVASYLKKCILEREYSAFLEDKMEMRKSLRKKSVLNVLLGEENLWG